MFSIIKQLAYELDLLKTPFSFQINGKSKNSTILGSLFSIVIISILYISFSQSNMIQKKNPYISEKNIKYPTSNNIFFKNNLFFLCLGDFSRECHVDKSIFTIDARIKVQNGSVLINENIMNIKQCTKQDLEKLNLNEFDPNKMFCMEEKEFVLFGNSNENFMSSLLISIRLCNEEIDGIKCKGDNEIINYLSNKLLVFGFSEYSFDMENYEQPYMKVNKIITTPIHFKSRDLYEIYFKKVLLKTDENWIFNDEKKEKEEFFITNNEIIKNLDILNIMNHNTINNPLILFQLQSSPNEQVLFRKYQKLQEVLANLSGLANFLIIFGLIIIRIHTHINLISIVNNTLLNFDSKLIRMKNKLQNSSHKNNIEDTKIELKEIINNNVKNIDQVERDKLKNEKEIKEKNKIKSYFEIFPYFFEYSVLSRNTKKNLFTIFDYFLVKLKLILKRSLNEKEKNVLEAEQFYLEKIDIVFFLKKLQELEYLKKVLLSPIENKLFFLLIQNHHNSCESDNLPKKQMYYDYLENYKLLLNAKDKSTININFLEFLMKNLENHENLMK